LRKDTAKPAPAKPSREDRLAEALRTNLKRRKAQTRRRAQSGAPAKKDSGIGQD
jgi:hypothetical protein